jgi:hypothetical protein
MEELGYGGTWGTAPYSLRSTSVFFSCVVSPSLPVPTADPKSDLDHLCIRTDYSFARFLADS